MRFPAWMKFVLIWVEYTPLAKKKNTVQRSKTHPSRRAMASHGDTFLLQTEAQSKANLIEPFSGLFSKQEKNVSCCI